MNTYISIWQFIIGITTTPIMFLYLTYAYDNPINFINYINNGIRCQMAISSNDNCNKSLFWLVIYQFISTTTSTLSFIIIKYGSATILIILTNIKIPLTCFISYILINYNFIYTTTLQRLELSIYNISTIVIEDTSIPNKNMMVIMIVNSNNGKKSIIKLHKMDTVLSLKNIIYDIFEIRIENQHLIFGNNELDDRQIVSECGLISNSSTVYVKTKYA